MASTFVAGGAAGNTTGTTLTLALDAAVAIGDVITVIVMRRNAFVSLTDNLSTPTTYTVRQTFNSASPGDHDMTILTGTAVAAGTPTLTLTVTSASRKGLAANAWRTPQEPTTDADATEGTSTTPTSPALTVGGAGVVIGGVTKGSVAVITAGTGYGNLYSDAGTGRIGVEAKAVSGAGSETPNFTLGSSENWICGGVVIQEPAVGGGRFRNRNITKLQAVNRGQF